jgi:hypothetical protein
MIEVTEVSLTFAQIRTAQSVPVLILAAPATGYVRIIFGITAYMDNVGADYVNPASETYSLNGDPNYGIFTGTLMSNQGAAQESSVSKSPAARVLYAQTIALYFSTSNDDATGQHGMKLRIVSELKQIV